MKFLKYFGKQKRHKLSWPLIIRRVTGNSMLPTLYQGQIIGALTWFVTYHEGDVVVFRHKGLDKIKRIRAITAHGLSLYGDNHLQSTDSRSFGMVEKSSITGKVVWPIELRRRYLDE